jgi:hypothetical protein
MYPLWMTLLWKMKLTFRPDLAQLPGASDEKRIPESVLVALAGLQQFKESWVSDDDCIKTEESATKTLRESLGEEWLRRYNPVDKHTQRFREWGPVPASRAPFLKLAAGVRMSRG